MTRHADAVRLAEGRGAIDSKENCAACGRPTRQTTDGSCADCRVRYDELARSADALLFGDATGTTWVGSLFGIPEAAVYAALSVGAPPVKGWRSR